ncbi:MAG TPA: multidrug transporter subunit MdtA, partial [Thermodesulfobacteriota bacterium]|nr:multidrug transporter subunit MdtA [Thermodesulfobacteriota bacterium]
MKRTHKTGLLRHWWIVLLAICLVAIGAYVFFIKSQSRAAKESQNQLTRTVPVVAVEAKKTVFNVYISGLGSVTPHNTVTVKSR